MRSNVPSVNESKLSDIKGLHANVCMMLLVFLSFMNLMAEQAFAKSAHQFRSVASDDQQMEQQKVDDQVKNCLTDFHQNTKKIRHTLTPFDMRVIHGILKKGEVSNGWNYLAYSGDGYALMARNVVKNSTTFVGKTSHALIRSHWIHTTGLENYETLFAQVALQHFIQYVEILDTGFWPDSDQILLSYIRALQMSGIDGVTAFDVTWQNTFLEPIMSWQEFVKLPEDRIVFDSKICKKSGGLESHVFILADFLLVLPESLFLKFKSLF